MQVHGGMGFIEETGAAQYLRDARITTIYEGTTGIQATDLVGRKIARDGGATAKAWLAEAEEARRASSPVIPTIRQQALAAGAQARGRVRRLHRRQRGQGPASACSPARCRSSS